MEQNNNIPTMPVTDTDVAMEILMGNSSIRFTIKSTKFGKNPFIARLTL